ncbi:hypothetical protein ACTD5D_17035 [Nocardia takedensis]|uniref:hypothetical protein n=1 Tax=Nocardia takedensis TaxID=259390 RepID=UPI00030F4622|nr:hypothetical protein [Nocardia takedensis]
MPSYTVVIIPDSVDDQRARGETPRLTVRVETTAQEARVTEIALSSTSVAGLTAASVDAIDMTAIVTALAAKFRPTAALAEPTRPAAPAPAADATPEPVVPPKASAPVRRETATPAPSPRAGEEPGRAYRRMPDVDELRAIYDNLGTVTAVAKHYDVPRHTAQGWMGRLRKLDQPANA